MGKIKVNSLILQVVVVVVCFAVLVGLLNFFLGAESSIIAIVVFYLLWAIQTVVLTYIVSRSRGERLSGTRIVGLCISVIVGALLVWFGKKDAYTTAFNSGANPFVAVWFFYFILMVSSMVPLFAVMAAGTRRLPNTILAFAVRFFLLMALVTFSMYIVALALSPLNPTMNDFLDSFITQVFNIPIAYFIVYSFVNDSREIFAPKVKSAVEDEN